MNLNQDFHWLSHDGEMAQLIRKFDWSTSPIGPVNTWPLSLKISLNLILNSGIAMSITWGKRSTYFYNDAYRPILGNTGRHPNALGKSMSESWPEVWSTVGPLHEKVITSGHQVFFEDFKFTLLRNGFTEDAYFNFSYSPLYGDTNHIDGILTTCVETTKVVLARNELEASKQELQDFLMQAPTPMCILMGDDHRFTMANEPYLKLADREVVGKTLKEVFQGEDIVVYQKTIDSVYATGEPVSLEETPLNIKQKSGEITDKYITTIFTPVFGDDRKPRGIMVQIQDVTLHVRTRDELKSERENFRNLFRQTPEMVCSLIGPKHTFDFVNEAHIKALGFDATGMEVRVAQPESVEIHGILDEVYRTGVTAHLREIPVTLGTKVRYFNLTYAARKDKNGTPNGIMILGAEITEQVEARLGIIKATYEAQTNLNKLDTIVHNLTEGLSFANPDGKVIYMNPECLRIHGFQDMEDYLLKVEEYPSFIEMYDMAGGIVPLERWPISKVLGGENFVDEEYLVRRLDIEHTWVGSFSGIRVLNQDGSPLMSVISVKDITSRKTIEIELKEALRARDEFLSIASHELRTPLTSLKMQLQLTSKGLRSQGKATPSPEKILKVFDISLKQVERLTSLIEDLLDVSRIQSGKLTHRFESTLIKPLIEDLVDRFQEQANHTHTPIDFVASSNPSVTCDPFRIDQVLTNLVSNALKYASGKPVKISLDVTDKFVAIRVQDYGMGIAEDKIPLIFNRFERAAAETNISGLGLGLYITKSIVEAHHGFIHVESELKKGTTFTVLLPLEN